MTLAPRLDLRQSQSLVMTPQLQQAVKLLALSNLEVEAFIAEEVERNPLLSIASEGGERAAQPEAPPPAGADTLIAGGAAGEPAIDIDYASESHQQDPLLDGGGARDGSLGSAGERDGPDFDRFAQPAASLHDHLLAQAGLSLSPDDHIIAAQLIDAIDEAGYLRASLLDLAARLGVALAQVVAVLGAVQRFDPVGVGARDLAECLALQAREADRYDPCMAKLIDNLDLVARGDRARLKRLCGVDDEDLTDMLRELRGYDPKPGCRFGGEASQAVVPDLFVTRTAGGWSVEINAATLPRVLVDRRYQAELTRGAGTRAAETWLAECAASANWLVKALDQRQRTIIAVATEIVRHQEAFFLEGVAHLRPLTLARVAKAIGMHESTVSRVTSNKYMACASGLFELKYFFTASVGSGGDEDGEGASAEAVRAALRALIATETDILSDDALVDALRGRGYDVARRTVAKYREAMGLGSSVQRRRVRAMGR